MVRGTLTISAQLAALARASLTRFGASSALRNVTELLIFLPAVITDRGDVLCKRDGEC